MILTTTLLILSATFKAICDTLQFHFETSIFNHNTLNAWFWNPQLSWRNKYKNCEPEQGKKFFGSTTIFVWTTDAWHMFQMLYLNCFFLCLALHIDFGLIGEKWIVILINFAIIKVVFQSFFEVYFRAIIKR